MLPIVPAKLQLYILALVLLQGIMACDSKESDLYRRTQFLMGTLVEITIRGGEKENAQKAATQAFDEIRRLEQLMSTYIADSEISRLNGRTADQPLTVSPEVLEVIQRGIHWGKKTHGALDISIEPVAGLWRFEEANPVVPDPLRLAQAASLVNYEEIEIAASDVRFKRTGMALNLGAIAKGYAVDRAMQILENSGIENALINSGGDLKTIGSREDGQPWKIGIQHPRNPEKLIATFSLSGKAVATSGDYQKYFLQGQTRYHHILNPENGMPARGVMSSTVIADSVVDTDALATAVFVLGPEKGIELIDSLDGVECMLVSDSGAFHFSRNFRSQSGFILKGLEDDLSH